MTNSSYSNFDYELCVKILNLLKVNTIILFIPLDLGSLRDFFSLIFVLAQGAFPARLKCVFIVSSPLWFRAPFAVLRLFVREKLRERVRRESPLEILMVLDAGYLNLSYLITSVVLVFFHSRCAH